jgi:hypothetical protein
MPVKYLTVYRIYPPKKEKVEEEEGLSCYIPRRENYERSRTGRNRHQAFHVRRWALRYHLEIQREMLHTIEYELALREEFGLDIFSYQKSMDRWYLKLLYM